MGLVGSETKALLAETNRGYPITETGRRSESLTAVRSAAGYGDPRCHQATSVLRRWPRYRVAGVASAWRTAHGAYSQRSSVRRDTGR
jgi:hypothetical protein